MTEQFIWFITALWIGWCLRAAAEVPLYFLPAVIGAALMLASMTAISEARHE